MKFNLAIFLTFIFLSFSLVAAQGCADEGWKGYSEISTNKTITITCPTCTYINFTLVNSNQEITLDNVGMAKSGSTFSYTFLNTTLNKTGTYLADGYSNLDTPLSFCFDVTPSGKADSIAYLFVNFILFLLIIGMMLGFAYFNKTINFEKWHNKILSKYEDKNPVRAFFSSLVYVFMRDPFLIYYLLGWVLLIIIEDIVFTFNLLIIHTLVVNMIDLYAVGLFIVGLMFVGIAYQFLKETWDKFDSLKWGLEK